MVEVQVKFEPEALGAISDTLVIDGGPQGEYKHLEGRSVAGPSRAGSSRWSRAAPSKWSSECVWRHAVLLRRRPPRLQRR